MYKKIFVKNNSDFEFQATPVYFFIDFEVMYILGHDFGERIKDSLIKQDMIRTMAYIKTCFCIRLTFLLMVNSSLSQIVSMNSRIRLISIMFLMSSCPMEKNLESF